MKLEAGRGKHSPDEEADFYETFKTPRGRRVLWKLLSESSPFADSMAVTPERTAYNLGRQAWGRRTMQMMHRSRRLRALLRKMEDENDEDTEPSK